MTAGEGAFVMATAQAVEHADAGAEKWRASFNARYKREPLFEAQQGYDSVRVLEHAIERPRAPTAPKMIKAMTTIDPTSSNSLGVVRFADDHRLLYDNRVILKVKDGAFTWERSLRTDSLQ